MISLKFLFSEASLTTRESLQETAKKFVCDFTKKIFLWVGFSYIKSLVFMDFGGMTVTVSLFSLPVAVLLVSLTSSLFTTAFSIPDRRIITVQFAYISQSCLGTTVLRSWLAQRRMVLLQLASFRSGFCILLRFWGSFRGILLFPVFVLFCWRLLLLIFLFRLRPFMEGTFTMVSTAVKNLALEKYFSPNVVRRFHGARNIPCFNVLI